MSLGFSGSFTADGPGEFRCDHCGARCTRNRSDGTEYGHLIGCPDRPDDVQIGSGDGRIYRPDQDESDGGVSA